MNTSQQILNLQREIDDLKRSIRLNEETARTAIKERDALAAKNREILEIARTLADYFKPSNVIPIEELLPLINRLQKFQP